MKLLSRNLPRGPLTFFQRIGALFYKLLASYLHQFDCPNISDSLLRFNTTQAKILNRLEVARRLARSAILFKMFLLATTTQLFHNFGVLTGRRLEKYLGSFWV